MDYYGIMHSSLKINNLSISVDSKKIVHSIDLTIYPGSMHVLMGPNGSGKSSLVLTLMGHPLYAVDEGAIVLQGQDITHLSPDKRVQQGLFLVFQYPPDIPGVTVFSFLKESYRILVSSAETIEQFTDKLHAAMNVLGIDKAFAQRTIDGFSGGEKKKFEMLQILLFEPKVVIFDEIDSGLDVDALQAVCKAMQLMRTNNPSMSILLITHYARILQYLQPEHVHIMKNGRIVSSGNQELAQRIEQQGYDEYRN